MRFSSLKLGVRYMLKKVVVASLVVMAIIAIAVMPAPSKDGELISGETLIKPDISGLSLPTIEPLEIAPTVEIPSLDVERELPIFTLTGPSAKSSDLAARVFGMKGGEEKEINGRSVTESDGKVLEVYEGSGGVWFENQNLLWNPEAKISLPDEKEALSIANNFLSENSLQPSKGILTLEPLGTSGTKVAIFDADKEMRTQKQLDIQVRYGLRLVGEKFNIPVVGGGGKYNVVIGNEKEIIGYNGPRPGLEAVAGKSYEVIPREKANAYFEEMTKGIRKAEYQSNLAYYIPPNMADQTYMIPVYIYSGTIVVDDEKVPMRNIMIPATAFESELYPGRGEMVAQEERVLKMLEPEAEKLSYDEESSDETLKIKQSYLEAGTSWIGLSGGLPGSQANAQGFVDGLRAAGWTIDFNWGDSNAFESDWNANDDSWVDDADIVFYTGHADIHSWMLRPPNDGWLSDSEIGAPGGARDLYGQNDLEWFFIAACGPLEDDLIHPGGGDVFRWKGVFDGLHIMCGYGAVTNDNTEEGETLVRYMKEGKTVIDSWFRTAKEIQPSTNGYSAPYGPEIYAGAMYAYKSGTTSPYNDHLHGYGSVAPDPINPNVYVCMWTPT